MRSRGSGPMPGRCRAPRLALVAGAAGRRANLAAPGITCMAFLEQATRAPQGLAPAHRGQPPEGLVGDFERSAPSLPNGSSTVGRLNTSSSPTAMTSRRYSPGQNSSTSWISRSGRRNWQSQSRNLPGIRPAGRRPDCRCETEYAASGVRSWWPGGRHRHGGQALVAFEFGLHAVGGSHVVDRNVLAAPSRQALSATLTRRSPSHSPTARVGSKIST